MPPMTAFSPPSVVVVLAMAIVVPVAVFCQQECEPGHMLFGGKCEPIRGHGEPCAGKMDSISEAKRLRECIT